MGRHNALVNGSRGEDGAIAAAPVIEPLALSRLLSSPRGPVSPVARARPEPPPAVSPGRRLDGDRLRRGSMWALASGVAAIAAIVSYSHIYDLARAHGGGSGAPARLLPLSVDMLILAGELMLLHEADAKGRRFALGWVLVWSGIGATLAANVTYGWQFGVAGAVLWGWPAYSFILAAGGMVAVVKRAAARDGTPAVIPAASPAAGPAVTPVAPAVPRGDTGPVTPARKPAARKPAAGGDSRTRAQEAAEAGVSKRTIQRRAAKSAPRKPAKP